MSIVTLLTIDTPTVVDYKGDTRPVVARFNRRITKDGQPLLVQATIYEVRPAGEYPKTVPAPFASCTAGKILHFDQWCEYQLDAQTLDGEPVGETYDSLEQDNGVESQRPDKGGAVAFADRSISEMEAGEVSLIS